MNKIISVVLLLITINSFSQKNKEVLVPFLMDSKYGFASTDGKLLIQPKYESAYPFYKNYELTTVHSNSKSLIINRKNKIILNASSDYIPEHAIASNGATFPKKPEVFAIKKYCHLDTCASFGITEAFDEGKVFDKMNNLYFVSNQEKVFLIDENGKQKTESFDRIRHIDYGELEYCITEDKLNQKYGLLNDQGEVLLTCVYDAINYKGKGVFTIRQGSMEREFKVKTRPYNANITSNITEGTYKIKRSNNYSGIVDSADQVVVDYIYDKLYPLNKDKFIFWKGKEVGIMDYKGNYLYKYNFAVDYSEIKNHAEFVAYTPFGKDMVFFNRDNKWVLIDLSGKQTGPGYDGLAIDYQFITGIMAGVCIDDKVGVINEKGDYILKPVYDKIYCLREDSSFVVKTNDKWSWLNAKGKSIVSDFDDFGYILENFLLILKEGKWFYVNDKGVEFRKK